VIRQGRYLSSEDTSQALVGEILAKNLQVSLGDELVVLGQGRDGSVAATVVEVKGIYNSGQDEFDRSSIHIPLSYFQDVYAMRGGVHEVVALGKSLGDIPAAKRAVAGAIQNADPGHHLVVLDWMDLMPGLTEGIKIDLISGLILYLILIVVVAFSILNTFLMSIFERTKEFGVLMAIGTMPGRLTKVLLFESITMTMIGIVVGMAAGSLITWYFQVHGIVIAGTSEVVRQFGIPERMFPRLSFLSVTIGPILVLFITVLTALYPALKVRRLRIVEALASV
jgi:ABC-type lipoprotein release transport system permease subunit